MSTILETGKKCPHFRAQEETQVTLAIWVDNSKLIEAQGLLSALVVLYAGTDKIELTFEMILIRAADQQLVDLIFESFQFGFRKRPQSPFECSNIFTFWGPDDRKLVSVSQGELKALQVAQRLGLNCQLLKD